LRKSYAILEYLGWRVPPIPAGHSSGMLCDEGTGIVGECVIGRQKPY